MFFAIAPRQCAACVSCDRLLTRFLLALGAGFRKHSAQLPGPRKGSYVDTNPNRQMEGSELLMKVEMSHLIALGIILRLKILLVKITAVRCFIGKLIPPRVKTEYLYPPSRPSPANRADHIPAGRDDAIRHAGAAPHTKHELDLLTSPQEIPVSPFDTV